MTIEKWRSPSPETNSLRAAQDAAVQAVTLELGRDLSPAERARVRLVARWDWYSVVGWPSSGPYARA